MKQQEVTLFFKTYQQYINLFRETIANAIFRAFDVSDFQIKKTIRISNLPSTLKAKTTLDLFEFLDKHKRKAYVQNHTADNKTNKTIRKGVC